MDWAAPALTSFVADSSSFRHLCCYGAGIAGNVFAFVLFISPLPTFKRIVRNGSTEQFSAMPYIYSLLNCLICMWYGLPFVSYGVVLVATVNSIGAVFQLAYTAVFIAFADAKQRLKVSALLAAVFVVFGLIVFVSLTLLDHTTRQMFVGYLSVASLIFMFASPLSIIDLLMNDPNSFRYCLAESGHQDEERGVHALLLVIIYVSDECIILRIRSAAA
ncbi:bidirectional sugar transporter SWEET2a-like isoform X2 [Miscanthus floridulus]|uniref:bidirectional sugar transporter SWEET2a-like isoform X2 n=1 Tax=Miscanthus floridulus TaxID=154761 RepID=UPI003458234D